MAHGTHSDHQRLRRHSRWRRAASTPAAIVAVDGARIAAVGPSAETPKADGFDEVIDAAGAIVRARPDQHAPAPLVHAVQGARRRLPAGGLGHRHPAAAVAQARCRRDARLELPRRHGDAGDRHDLLAQPFGDDHDDRELVRGLDRAAGGARHPAGLRQGAALPDARQSAPSAEPRRGAGRIRRGGAALERRARRPRAFRHGDRDRTRIGSRPA